MSVAIGRHHFENTIVDSKQRHLKYHILEKWTRFKLVVICTYVESATAQVKDEHILFAFFLVHSIGNSGRGGFVNNSHNCQTSNGSSILGSLTLGIIEVLKK